jgi:hypothetical protein
MKIKPVLSLTIAAVSLFISSHPMAEVNPGTYCRVNARSKTLEQQVAKCKKNDNIVIFNLGNMMDVALHSGSYCDLNYTAIFSDSAVFCVYAGPERRKAVDDFVAPNE